MVLDKSSSVPYAGRSLRGGGGGTIIHIFVFRPITFFWNGLFLRSVNTNIWISAPTQLSIRAQHWFPTTKNSKHVRVLVSELHLTLKHLDKDVAGGIPVVEKESFGPISVFHIHFSVLSSFQRFIPHFNVLSPFQCFIPISAFYSHFSVLSPFQRFILISVSVLSFRFNHLVSAFYLDPH